MRMTLLLGFLRSLFIRREALVFENLALRQQLAAYKRACKRLWVPKAQSSWNHRHFTRRIPAHRVPCLMMAWAQRFQSAPPPSVDVLTTMPAMGAACWPIYLRPKAPASQA